MIPIPFIKNPVLLAPLAGVSDMAFRYVCRMYGAGLTYTEMISAKGIRYGNHKTFALLNMHPEEDKVGVQLFGSEPETIAATAKQLLDLHGARIALFDVNMGCPVPKVVNNGEGCALMKNLPLASRIISSLKQAVEVPVTVKFRKGFSETNAVEFAKMAEESGADAVAVHGRTRVQMYEGKADWEIIAAVKDAVKIPVIGNGDVTSALRAKAMFDETNCDAVMIGRGALGNPFIFKEICTYLETGELLPPPSLEEKLRVFLLQAELTCRDKGERIAVREMRKHAGWYTKGIKHAAKIRERVVKAETLSELENILLELLAFS